MKIPKGRVFILSTGQYSDYSVQTICKAKIDLDAELLTEEFLNKYPENRKKYNANFGVFIKWLIVDKDIVEEINYSEWHIGDYSNISPDVREERGCYREGIG